MAGISDLIDKIKGLLSKDRKPDPSVMEGGDNPKYMKIFNFLWEQGFSQPQIDAIIRGEVNQTDILPERMQMDENMNFSIPQEPWAGARGGIINALNSLIPRMANGGVRDLRQSGGMSLGPGTEKSDSIPAMLSDGEFVMTSRAVRGLGDGSRKLGAKRLYDMMHKAERNATV